MKTYRFLVVRKEYAKMQPRLSARHPRMRPWRSPRGHWGRCHPLMFDLVQESTDAIDAFVKCTPLLEIVTLQNGKQLLCAREALALHRWDSSPDPAP
jgi:hypothetical protein